MEGQRKGKREGGREIYIERYREIQRLNRNAVLDGLQGAI